MRTRLTVLASLAVLGFSLAAHADTTITAAGPSFTLANGSTMPGSASNYDLFGWEGPTPSVLTNYTVTPNPSSIVFDGGSTYAYATIAAPGSTTAFTTGIDYLLNPICTFTTTQGGDFTVFILNANTDNNSGLFDSSVGLSTNGGPEVDIASGTGNQYQSLQFSEFDVTGATAGETFNVYANASGFATIGGISFANFTPSSPVPEPSSIALLGTGILTLAGAARRRVPKA